MSLTNLNKIQKEVNKYFTYILSVNNINEITYWFKNNDNHYIIDTKTIMIDRNYRLSVYIMNENKQIVITEFFSFTECLDYMLKDYKSLPKQLKK